MSAYAPDCQYESTSIFVDEAGDNMKIVLEQMMTYLLKSHFSSKRNMSEALGISYRTLLNVCAGRGSTNNINEVTSAILRYCIQHGRHDATKLNCCIGHMAREIVKDVAEFYTAEGDDG